MSEIELKFVLDEDATRKLHERLRAFGVGAAAKPATRTLRSVYFDTPDRALRKAGIALRLRRDGRRWIQTVKSRRQLTSGLSRTGELESPAPGGRLRLESIPDPVARAEVMRSVNGDDLQPVCETVIRRTARRLPTGDGGSAEVAIDVGEIRSGERTAPFREAEIELIDGSPGGLFDLAHALFPEGGIQFSRFSKAARGYMLAERGRIAPPLAPRNAEIVPLDPGQTAEQAARDLLRECFDQIVTNVIVVGRIDDPEGPHQLRVGLRRLRSALSVFAPAIGSPEAERLSGEARWLGQEVGRLRDLDVAIIDIVRPEARAHPGEPAFGLLDGALVRRAEDTRLNLRRTLVAERCQAFLLDLARFTETRGWLVAEDFGQTARLAQSVPDLAAHALDMRWNKVRRRARRIAALAIEARHELRKELKKLRYAAEFLAPLYPAKRVRPFVSHLKDLQTVFGDLNDAAMVHGLLSGPDAPAAADPAGQRACGWVIGARLARADHTWTGAKDLWHELKATRPFWH